MSESELSALAKRLAIAVFLDKRQSYEHIKDVLRFGGISDAWSRTTGRSKTTLNFVKAAVNALERASKMQQSEEITRKIGRMDAKERM